MASIKAKKAFQKVLKGSTITQAMKDVGYAATTASTTGKLTNTKTWQDLVNKFISDEKLLKVHKEGLEATHSVPQIVGRSSKGAPEYEYVKEPDYSVRHKYLETGYKIKGKAKEPEMSDIPQHTTNIVIITPHGANSN